ncbi:T9SS type A sorting domain-containing protein [Flavobacterium sp. J372]|uniref:T9SS type A sorting domain-containing protein n=1 Tax=Flavobacterium sp. J372 TaxID=2898436 RepID=UPI00215102F1|nr:T9SS type A sorting domain-containing protein [Flavobacterium sp. J372]MCR5861341.1 T9SS type A sorting domain-containing protein [Flavobacterium sp. J372]
MKKLLLSSLLLVTGLAFAQPANDNCANATVIPVNPGVLCTQTVSGTLTGATASGVANPTCTGNPNDDVWFSFTATSLKHSLTITPDTQGINILYALYTGDCSNLTYKGCANITSPLLNNIVVGETYKVRVYSQSANPQTVNFTACINTAEVITTDATITPAQVIETLTGNSPCVSVSNITYSGGSTYGQPASIGTFNRNNTSFPLASGIILSTGAVAAAPGPNSTVQSSNPGWPGDAELQLLGGVSQLNDATKLEFDFIPQIDHMSFDYIFASEEYEGTYACNFGDVFAFILTDMVTGEKTNLAVVPGTNTRVSVLTIRDMQYFSPAACPSVNPQYFGNFYGALPFAAPVNFNGMTVPLTAQSTVIPGRQYHIKLVIANALDHTYNSAVFLKAGSFNIGDITSGYTNLTSSNGTILCNGQDTVLSVNGSNTLNYSWKLNGVPIQGATSNTLTVAEAGTYTVTIAMTNGSGCSVERTIEIHSATSGTAPDLNDMWVYEVNSDGQAPFDLAAQVTAITNMTGYADMYVTFHVTQAAAEAYANALPMPYINTANPQVIYARIQNPENDCYVISQFSIGAVDENYQTPPPTGPGIQGFVPGDTLADIEIEGENILWYDNPGSDATGKFTTDSVDTPLPLTTLLVDGMTYYASQTKFGRESVERLPVTIDAAMGTNGVNFKNFSYRPNPVKDILQLSNGAAIDKVEVYNIVGQKVKSENVGKTDVSVDLNSLTNGVYIVKVTSANTQKSIKIIKQ